MVRVIYRRASHAAALLPLCFARMMINPNAGRFGPIFGLFFLRVIPAVCRFDTVSVG